MPLLVESDYCRGPSAAPNYLRVIKEDFMLADGGDYGALPRLSWRISPALVVAPQKPWNMIISSLFFRTVRFARDQPNGFIFSFSEISSRSQFLWWILDIYKGKQRETGATGVLRVHENVANSSCAPPPTTSAELIFLFLLPPEKHHKSLFFSRAANRLHGLYVNVARLSVGLRINAMHIMGRLRRTIVYCTTLIERISFINLLRTSRN